MLLPLLTLLGSTLAAPHVFDSRDPLNPYSDGRRLMFKGDKFKVVLFSDLHYGERDGNNTWAEWGVWQVRCALYPTDSRTETVRS